MTLLDDRQPAASPVTPTPEHRVWSARMTYKMRGGAKPGPDTADLLLSFLEGLVKDGGRVSPESLAEAAEYAVRLGVASK